MSSVSPAALKRFHQQLHKWYARHGRRDLPWRNTKDAYAIYVSEVMLQQTQVQTVLARFYHPFLEAFSSLQALADAPRDAVLKRWEGLGYYSRATNLHKAAQQAAPELPRGVDELMALPGIGRNTAHAIAAFAHHAPVAVMEANVKRVLCRVFALENPKPDMLWQQAEALLDKRQPFDYNQAMMDIGAMVCTRRAPDCGQCPAQEICSGKASPEHYPAPRKKAAVPVRRGQIVIWRNAAGELYLAPRETAFLGGLYAFAEYPAATDTVSLHNRAYALADAQYLGEVSQTYSHFRMEARLWLVQTDEGSGEGWYAPEAIAALALSGIDHKALAILRRHPG
jgi:A/G-specific adenine glycosylase